MTGLRSPSRCVLLHERCAGAGAGHRSGTRALVHASGRLVGRTGNGDSHFENARIGPNLRPLKTDVESMLFEVKPVDPATYLVVAAVLLGAAALASFVPSLRASAVDPVEALRAE